MGKSATIRVTCPRCQCAVDRDAREVRRSAKLGRPLFCGRRCSALAANASKRACPVERTCPCGTTFVSTTKARAPEHCSRGCASRYSMNDARREAQRLGGLATCSANLPFPSETLKKREAWKYDEVAVAVGSRPHEFEYPLGGYVFDLALLDVRTLVEFDGPSHRSEQARDAVKDAVAREHGFTLVRRHVRPSAVVEASAVAGL